jgi:site-specific recombinase XerD
MRAGLPTGLRFHDLRHTAVALLVDQGAHPLAVRERLGHSSITTTMDRYGHLFPSLDESLTEGLDRAHTEAVAKSRVGFEWVLSQDSEPEKARSAS